MSVPARWLLSAAHKSSGKTTLAIGLAAALRGAGHAVQTFKKGPDYIDPMWLAEASARPCFNLDPQLMGWGEIDALVQREVRSGGQGGGPGADVTLVEGNKGLYDGLALDGSNSNAALAKRLGLPVVLVIDARGMTRGVAPLILGYQAFDRELRIAGVILNRLGGSRHEAKLRAVIEHYTDVPVLGAVQQDAALEIVERHLGLVPNHEAEAASRTVARLADAVRRQVDLDRLLAVTAAGPGEAATVPGIELRGPAPAVMPMLMPVPVPNPAADPVRIGVAMDRAFGFYYADDLRALREAGAEIVAIDTLHDTLLPPRLDGLFLGGGFPETSAAEIAANTSLRSALQQAIVGQRLPTYAECGGLMLLARSLRTLDGQMHPMVGAIPGDVVMHARPVGRGYVRLRPSGAAPWSALAEPPVQGAGDDGLPADGCVHAHEFHYSSLENLDPAAPIDYAWQVERGHGIDGRRDGLLIHRLWASYSHLRSVGHCRWAGAFVAHVRAVRDAAPCMAVSDLPSPVLRTPRLSRPKEYLPC
ncbi:cobyrinate a,c-diamide synthase [Sphaerotilus microaerophilus]|uniref:Cobyrinate a,c-diamide synthase n=1 Tax=Sphaerotilus microaerophilus TaxID=2914710 RepID=A0ABM7YTC5_9BURK|nr:cobyrinate a,c-diamide synthase [Sphaerotilus sp. FB-5]BDI07921.1 cobyrinate a,c-diamide synthase [Sphaerotilus sp. FB-5]